LIYYVAAPSLEAEIAPEWLEKMHREGYFIYLKNLQEQSISVPAMQI
jgi:hypothetical protein